MLATKELFETTFFFALKHESVWHASAKVFNVVAGVASGGRPLPREAVRAACCTAPFGGTFCGASFCTGSGCGGTYSCSFVTGFCESGTSCWVVGTNCFPPGCPADCTCCDCLCQEPPPFSGQFYCYCTNC